MESNKKINIQAVSTNELKLQRNILHFSKMRKERELNVLDFLLQPFFTAWKQLGFVDVL